MSTISLLSKRTTKSSLSYFSSDFDVAETDNLADQSLFYKNGQHLTSWNLICVQGMSVVFYKKINNY